MAGSLAAWRHRHIHPGRSLCVVESGATLGGNHTWSFQTTDLTPTTRQWLRPLIVARWPRYRVLFPEHGRTMESEYCTITSERLHAVVARSLTGVVISGAASDVTPTRVQLTDGRTVNAHVVIDARGAGQVPGALGWQTFLGRDVECQGAHGLADPILMDATVPQVGAMKFMYVLPLSPTRLLIEDTAYADTPDLDRPAARAAIDAYAAARRWDIREVIREEVGALPIPLGGDIDAFWTSAVTPIGARAGLFHPTTGYSLPDAAETADLVANAAPFTPEGVRRAVQHLAAARWRQRGFFRLLNRWLFRAATPETRATLLSQFYSRPEATIARFYAGRLTFRDHLHLLSGRPAVSVWKALRHLQDQ